MFTSHLLSSFALDFLRDALNVVAAVLLVGLDKLVEISLGPVAETLLQQILLLRQFLFRQHLGIVDLLLFFTSHTLGVAAQVWVLRHLGLHKMLLTAFCPKQKFHYFGNLVFVLPYRAGSHVVSHNAEAT